MYAFFDTTQHSYYNLDIRSYLRLHYIKSHYILFLAMISNVFNFLVPQHYLILILYAALWKQCTETKDCPLIHGLLCTCTFIQRNQTVVYMLTLRSFRN
jgi:hypothetical protein